MPSNQFMEINRAIRGFNESDGRLNDHGKFRKIPSRRISFVFSPSNKTTFVLVFDFMLIRFETIRTFITKRLAIEYSSILLPCRF